MRLLIVTVCCLSVSEVSAASLNASWSAPIENADGSALVDLAGYRLYYGLASGAYDGDFGNPSPITVTAPTTEQVIEGAPSCDSVFVAVTAHDHSGNESETSTEVEVMLPTRPEVTLTASADTVRVNWIALPSGDSGAVDRFLIHYGFSGGTLNGTGAVEGSSPVEVLSSDAAPWFELSGLPADTTVFVAVEAVCDGGGARLSEQVSVVVPSACTDADGDGYGSPGSADCSAGAELDCDDGNAAVSPIGIEICNGVDDNCDGVIDENWPALGSDCNTGVGACAATGTWVCASDQSGATCDAVSGLPTTESCDGVIDDDCDGTIDNGCPCTNDDTRTCYAGPGGTEGTGVCAGGTQTCELGAWGNCHGQVLPGTEVCGDGIDQDCDGADLPCPSCEDSETRACYSGPADSAGVGLCRVGVRTCAGDAWSDCEGEITPVDENCSTDEDDDCDGEVNEDCEVEVVPIEIVGGCAATEGRAGLLGLLLLGLVLRRRS